MDSCLLSFIFSNAKTWPMKTRIISIYQICLYKHCLRQHYAVIIITKASLRRDQLLWMYLMWFQMLKYLLLGLPPRHGVNAKKRQRIHSAIDRAPSFPLGIVTKQHKNTKLPCFQKITRGSLSIGFALPPSYY